MSDADRTEHMLDVVRRLWDALERAGKAEDVRRRLLEPTAIRR